MKGSAWRFEGMTLLNQMSESVLQHLLRKLLILHENEAPILESFIIPKKYWISRLGHHLITWEVRCLVQLVAIILYSFFCPLMFQWHNLVWYIFHGNYLDISDWITRTINWTHFLHTARTRLIYSTNLFNWHFRGKKYLIKVSKISNICIMIVFMKKASEFKKFFKSKESKKKKKT